MGIGRGRERGDGKGKEMLHHPKIKILKKANLSLSKKEFTFRVMKKKKTAGTN